MAEKPESDAEKAPEEHEVREVGQVDHVRAGPSDESKLNEEKQEAEQAQPGTVCQRRSFCAVDGDLIEEASLEEGA